MSNKTGDTKGDASAGGLPLPLPLFESRAIGHVVGKDGATLTLRVGLDEGLVQQLQKYSKDLSDTELQRYTSDCRRFGEGSYEEWYEKKRCPFALVDEAGALAALIWFGPEPIPTGFTELYAEERFDTIAFRSYPPYRGAGLMGEFGRQVLALHARRFPERAIWLETDADNEAGRRLYTKLGFAEIGLRKDNGRLVMVRE